MAISAAEVKAIARLARIAIDESEIAAYAAQLSQILSFVEHMNSVSTAGVEPMAHPWANAARLRADEITETDQRSRLQAVAPQVENGYYLVPRVIE